MNTQMNEQITKHNNIIATKEKIIDEAEFGMTMAKLTGLEAQFMGKYECRVGDCKSHIKHSQLMIRLFTTYTTTPFNSGKIKIIYNLIKANAMDIEHFMSLGVQEGVYSENFYKEHVEGFMEEINVLARFLVR
tara:strand:+ start:834 stop:1232 length:399 start_codon:yes stop_codon:yes gene_type:complete